MFLATAKEEQQRSAPPRKKLLFSTASATLGAPVDSFIDDVPPKTTPTTETPAAALGAPDDTPKSAPSGKNILHMRPKI